MKKVWFKRKRYGLVPLEAEGRYEPSRPLTGWGWVPDGFAGWLVMLFYIAANVFVFRSVDLNSHSVSDTLINFAPRFLLLTAVLYLICWWKGEKPRFQWGKQSEDPGDLLAEGGIAVMPTDTTYGIVGSALNEKVVNEIYRLRKRDLEKPFIILIADKKDFKKFGVIVTPTQEKILDKVWPKTISSDKIVRPTDSNRFRPDPTSVILPCPHEKFAYLHRGKNTLAFRLPKKEDFRRLLREVGPLVAPSANPQGLPVAKNISEARAYFGHHVSLYQDVGTIVASPSKLIDITDGTEKVLRP